MVPLLIWLSAVASGQEIDGAIPSAYRNDLNRCAFIMPREGIMIDREVHKFRLAQLEVNAPKTKRQRRLREAAMRVIRARIEIFDQLIAHEEQQLADLETKMLSTEPNMILPTLTLESCVQTATLFGVSRLQLPNET